MMRTSLFLFIGERGDAPVVDDYLARLVQARDEGFTMIWTAQSPRGPDVLTVLAHVLPEVEGIDVGSRSRPATRWSSPSRRSPSAPSPAGA